MMVIYKLELTNKFLLRKREDIRLGNGQQLFAAFPFTL